jgi:ubiquinol-cytochrome c reductase cytochrome b subunit
MGNWLDDRTGIRSWRRRVLDEPMPAGTGWWFTLGGLLLFGLFVQAASGIALALFYVPTADHAWDSVHFILTRVRGGAILRGLHYWGAGLVMASAALHLARVVFFGSYRRPREVTWLTGLGLFALLLGLAITGAVLPWDQRAYWSIGVVFRATALTPWYVIHVIALPAVVVILTAKHLYLIWRHGISGPVTLHSGPAQRFYPNQVRRIRVVVLAAAVVLGVLAWKGAPTLQPPADVATRGYVPRPDWYFLGAGEAARLVPAAVRAAAGWLVAGVVTVFLVLLPWLDRARTRESGPRWRVLVPFAAILGVALALTAWGVRDVPRVDQNAWNFQEIAGAALIQSGDRCVRCHRSGGVAAPVEAGHIVRPPGWLTMHVADPEVLAAGIREAPFVNQADSRAMLAALSHLRSSSPPAVDAATLRIYTLLSRFCVECHQLDGAGGTRGPDLSHAGLKFDATTLEQRITDAHDVRPDTPMPAFSGIIDPADIKALAEWLAQRK